MKHSIAIFAVAALSFATPSFAMEPVKRICVQASDTVERCEYLSPDGHELKPYAGPWNASYNAATQTVCADEGGSAYKPITRDVIMCGPIEDFPNGIAPAAKAGEPIVAATPAHEESSIVIIAHTKH